MSFILDALRKAETRNRDRHDLTVPTGPRVLTEELPEAPKQRRTMAWFALPLVLMIAALLWFVLAGSPTPPQSNNQSVAVDRPDPATVTTPATRAIGERNEPPAARADVQRETGARALDREVRRGLSPPVQNPPSQSAAARTSTPANPARVTPGTVRILEPANDATGAAQAGATGSVEVETLPEYRSTLAAGDVPVPQLHLDMHVYSRQPEKRFVFINLEKYAEGEEIDGDTVVESIEPQGAVINYKGYRFVLRPE